MSLYRIFRFNDMPNTHIKESGVSNTYTSAVPKYLILLFYSCFMWQVIILLQTLFLSPKNSGHVLDWDVALCVLEEE